MNRTIVYKPYIYLIITILFIIIIIIDTRTSHWFLVENPWPVFAIVATYLLFVKYGTLAMKNREPFDLKYLMLVYNFVLVVLSVYISSEVSDSYKMLL